MKHRHMLAIGLAAYALALIASAPASLLDAGLRHITDSRLRLAATQGTLWSGSGQFEIRDSNKVTGISRSLDWRIRLSALPRGKLVYEIDLGQSRRPFPVTLSPSRIALTDTDIDLPAAALALGSPRLAALNLTGDILLHIDSLSIGREQTLGKLSLQWRNAGSAYTSISPLGDYELNLDSDGKTIQALLHTLDGPLQLDGKGSWINGGNPDFLAVARVPPQHRQQLSPLLRMIATERGAGDFEFQLH